MRQIPNPLGLGFLFHSTGGVSNLPLTQQLSGNPALSGRFLPRIEVEKSAGNINGFM